MPTALIWKEYKPSNNETLALIFPSGWIEPWLIVIRPTFLAQRDIGSDEQACQHKFSGSHTRDNTF